MNQPALPAYLQNLGGRRLADDATAGLGTSLPAHISTEGGVFTLIDAAGNPKRLTFKAQDGREYQQPFLDACVVDLNAAVSKLYYGGEKYNPDSTKPPVCFSANGDVPSNDSSQKQARTCAECKWNERGSAVSEKSGASIKACRDEKWLALMVPQSEVDTVFRYKVTPGSFKKWKAYTEAFKKGPVDIKHVVTRFEFDPDEPNTIKFQAVSYIDERTAGAVAQALAAKATDMIVGRDQAVAQLPPPAPQLSLEQQAAQGGPSVTPLVWPNASNTASAVAPSLSTPIMPLASPATSAATASPSEAPAPGRRRRNAAPQAAPAQQQAPLAAPFPTGAPPANGAAPGPQFGIQQGVAPDPALSATLANLFGTKQ